MVRTGDSGVGLNFTLGKTVFSILFITSLLNIPEVERTTCQEKLESHCCSLQLLPILYLNILTTQC